MSAHFAKTTKRWSELHAEQQRQQDEEDGNEITVSFVQFISQAVAVTVAAQAVKSIRGGSRVGRRPNIDRNRQQGHERIMSDYFSDAPVYNDNIFRRRFRMQKSLFVRIMNDVTAFDTYFQQKPDALGVPGLSTIQNFTATSRLHCYGVAADAVDEYVRIAETTTSKCLQRFCAAIVGLYTNKYMRNPTPEDVQHWLAVNEARGFPGMFGSLDCTHWQWQNCPVVHQGQYQDKSGKRSVILEAIATQDIWIWHAYVGLPVSSNDLNVLDRYLLVGNLIRGAASQVEYAVNNKLYNTAHLLCNGIYPSWPIFINQFRSPARETAAVYSCTRGRAQGRGEVLWCATVSICNTVPTMSTMESKPHAADVKSLYHIIQHGR